MYAIIRSGGKQYRVEEGDVVYLEKLDGEVGDQVELEALAISDGDNLKLAKDLDGATVKGEIVKQGRGKKIRVYKMKPKKRYRRTQGHRQAYTAVRISSL